MLLTPPFNVIYSRRKMSDPDYNPNSFTDSEGELCRETDDVQEFVQISPAPQDIPQSSQGLTQVSGELFIE